MADFSGPRFEPGGLGRHYTLVGLMRSQGRRTYFAPERLRGRTMRLADGRVLGIAENGFAHLRAASAGRGRVERPSKAGVTSRARPLKFIPKLTELACVELTRRDEIANPRRALRSGPRAVSTAKSSLFL